MTPDEWTALLDSLIVRHADGDADLENYLRANADAVKGAVDGRGPDDTTPDRRAGARVVVNISSAHVPAFCTASRSGDPRPYKNGYDLDKYRVGDPPAGGQRSKREIVDAALPLGTSSPADLYFGAVELNGTGVRFYGDMCLVLSRATADRRLAILDRNSYDLVRDPIRTRVDAAPDPDKQRRQEADKLSGTWLGDLGTIAAIKTLQALPPRTRRHTTGQISQTICDDEDYVEVLKIGSFAARDLQEARLSAAEAAHDALAGDRSRQRLRPTPRLEALMWRARRRWAEQELRREGVRVRVVTTSGRTRG